MSKSIKFINFGHHSIPESEINSIDWCSQVNNDGKNEDVVQVDFGEGNETYLYPEAEDDLVDIYNLLEETQYKGVVCNMPYGEFTKTHPRPVQKAE